VSLGRRVHIARGRQGEAGQDGSRGTVEVSIEGTALVKPWLFWTVHGGREVTQESISSHNSSGKTERLYFCMTETIDEMYTTWTTERG
jgi:hypothetical protein